MPALYSLKLSKVKLTLPEVEQISSLPGIPRQLAERGGPHCANREKD